MVGLSGGVDSAVAALLMKNAGARVLAVFMKSWRDDDTTAACHDKQDLITAAAVADTLGVGFDTVDFVEDYRRFVFTPFLNELRSGRTPNPDIVCNSAIKFTAFLNYAKQQGAAVVVTGHYARVTCLDKEWRLHKGEDSAKDQSYFLHRLTTAQLAQVFFPLGGMHKADVRALAQTAGLDNWARKDSTGICFIGERPFYQFLSRYLPDSPGDIVDDNDHVLGRHKGLAFYTIGQRRGLGLSGGPWFVAGKEEKGNYLRVVCGHHHPLLFASQVRLKDTHWINAPPPPQRVYAARLRHRQEPASCVLSDVGPRQAVVDFAEPQWAPAPGQYAVIYDGNVCLGGGVIV